VSQRAEQASAPQADGQAEPSDQDAATQGGAASTSRAVADAAALEAKIGQQPGKAQSSGNGGGDASAQGDAELVMSAVRKLKQLLAAIKGQLKNNDDLKKAEQQVQAAQNIAEQLAGVSGGLSGGATASVSVRV